LLATSQREYRPDRPDRLDALFATNNNPPSWPLRVEEVAPNRHDSADGSMVANARLILWLKILGVLIVAELILATTLQGDSARRPILQRLNNSHRGAS